MADLFEVECPCCSSVLQIDPETKTIIRHREPAKKPMIEDLAAAVQQLKGEAERRQDVFSKSFDAHLNSEKVREKKFEELLKQAKEDPSKEPPKRAFDFD
jgi:hypothetical protein